MNKICMIFIIKLWNVKFVMYLKPYFSCFVFFYYYSSVFFEILYEFFKVIGHDVC